MLVLVVKNLSKFIDKRTGSETIFTNLYKLKIFDLLVEAGGILFADLIIHVRDISHEDYHSQKQDVLNIIREIFEYDDNQLPDKPRLTNVFT